MELDSKYLLKECEDFEFSNPQIDPEILSKNLIQTMTELNGLGLAANQVGVPYRAFAMRHGQQSIVCFNPEIQQYSSLNETIEEGCLSYPKLYVKIKRPASVHVSYYTADGKYHTETIGDLSARIFQHEYDHLQGNLFFNKANRFHREKALKGWRKTNA